MTKSIGAAEFKAKCLNLIEQMSDDGEPVLITKRGRPVAVLSPLPPQKTGHQSIIGAMKGSVSSYEDAFSPALDPQDWDAVR